MRMLNSSIEASTEVEPGKTVVDGGKGGLSFPLANLCSSHSAYKSSQNYCYIMSKAHLNVFDTLSKMTAKDVL